MIALKIFAYIFYAYGLTTIMVYGRGPFGLCETIRRIAGQVSDGLGELFGCPLCFSTWVGMLTSLMDILLLKKVALTPFSVILASLTGFWGAALTVLLDGFFTAGLVWFLHQIEEALERHGNYYTEEVVEEVEDEQ